MRIRCFGLTVCSVAIVFASSAAFAQTPPPQGPAEIVLPPPPKVDDPALTPLPPAKRVVATWDEITAYLRSRSADLRIAVDEIGRAEAQSRVALAGLLGSINTTGTYTHNFLTASTQFLTQSGAIVTTTTPTPDYATGNIVALLPIIAPRTWNGLRSAHVTIDVAKASLDDEKRLLATGVANSALAVVTAENISDLNRVGLRQALERFDLAKRKTNLGAGTGLDVVRAQQDVEAARATLVTGDESARQAREAFGLALGVPEDVGVGGDLGFEQISAQVLSQCKAAPSVDQRPDVVAARERVHLANLGVWDVKTQFFPILNVQSTLATTTISTATPQTTWNFQAILSWNIWDGGVRYGNLRDTNLQVLEAQERLEATRRTALIQVVQAERGVKVSQESRDVAARSRDLAKEVDRLTRAGFMAGTGTSLDLVTAAAALRQAEINLALSDFGLVKAKILAVLSLATCPL